MCCALWQVPGACSACNSGENIQGCHMYMYHQSSPNVSLLQGHWCSKNKILVSSEGIKECVNGHRNLCNVDAGLLGSAGHLHWCDSCRHCQCRQKQDGCHLTLHAGDSSCLLILLLVAPASLTAHNSQLTAHNMLDVCNLDHLLSTCSHITTLITTCQLAVTLQSIAYTPLQSPTVSKQPVSCCPVGHAAIFHSCTIHAHKTLSGCKQCLLHCRS